MKPSVIGTALAGRDTAWTFHASHIAKRKAVSREHGHLPVGGNEQFCLAGIQGNLIDTKIRSDAEPMCKRTLKRQTARNGIEGENIDIRSR